YLLFGKNPLPNHAIPWKRHKPLGLPDRNDRYYRHHCADVEWSWFKQRLTSGVPAEYVVQ
ncbi:MAG: hypothetical protein JW810_00940, partial [Sedimentisphaerales bacterium]|nr:hypothetical protein [Sedimentisphaerales bacterium]